MLVALPEAHVYLIDVKGGGAGGGEYGMCTRGGNETVLLLYSACILQIKGYIRLLYQGTVGYMIQMTRYTYTYT